VFAVGDTEPSQTTLDVDLVIRQSCGCEH
jgi:hypothetical protein